MAKYSEISDLFELLDGVSKGTGDAGRVYRDTWEKKFSLTTEMKSDFKDFQEIRNLLLVKKSHETKEEDIFGKPPVQDDLFAEIFHQSRNLNQVYKLLLKNGFQEADVRLVANIIKKYQPQLRTFIKESTHFSVKLLDFNKDWKYKKYGKAMKRVEPFVLSKARKKKFKFTIRPVWWPAHTPPQIDWRGDVLLLRYNPISHTTNWNHSLIFQKAIEQLIHFQSPEQRSNLTTSFKQKCAGRELELRTALVTLFGVMLPEHYQNPKTFSAYGDYASSHFVDLYLKLLYPLMEQEMKKKASYAGEFMDQATTMCRSLHRLSVLP